MPTAEMMEGALVVGVNRALHATADAAHQVITTPATVAIEGVKSATVFVASHLIVGGIKLGCTVSWWLLTSAATAVGAGATLAYHSLFGSSEPKYTPVSYNSADSLFQENHLSPRSADMDTASSARKNDPTPSSFKPSLLGID